MAEDGEGFGYPVVDDALCTRCGVCEKACPVLRRAPPREPFSVHAAINRDESVRMRSSSGGIFTLLARQVFSTGGIVFGAGWSHDFRVVHTAAENEVELADLRGAKYVQSDLGDVFQQVAGQLATGREVLFSGTPCQIAGLRSFLAESRRVSDADVRHLLCVDVVCFATPSPKVFALYKQELEARHGASATQIVFRDKLGGWANYALSVVFGNGQTYRAPHGQDPYLQGFVKGLYNRPSCSGCAFRELRSGADITIADYWKVRDKFPAMDDDKGTSLVLATTPAGCERVKALRSGVGGEAAIWAESDYADARLKNAAIYRSFVGHKNRDAFFARLENGPVSTLIRRLLRPSLSRRLRAFFRRRRLDAPAT